MKDTWSESLCVDCGTKVGYLPEEHAGQRWRCPDCAKPDEPGYHPGQAQFIGETEG